MSNQTKLQTSITSGFINNSQLTNQHLDFIGRLQNIRHAVWQKMPHDPNRCTDSMRFELDTRARNLFDQAQEVYKTVEALSDQASKLMDTLRKESGQNELVYLEEITDLFPSNFRISTEIENDYRYINFNVVFSIKDFPNCAKLPEVLKEAGIYKNDIEICLRNLNNGRLGYAKLNELQETKKEYNLASQEITDLNNMLQPLIDRGFNASLVVKSISSRGMVCKFSLSSNNN